MISGPEPCVILPPFRACRCCSFLVAAGELDPAGLCQGCQDDDAVGDEW